MNKILAFLILSLAIFGCTQDKLENPLDTNLTRTLQKLSPTGELDHFVLPDSDNLHAIPQGVGNPLTPEKVALGKMLFYETGLALDAMHESGVGTYSCSSCHIPSAGFMPGRVQGIADGGIGFGFNGEQRDQIEGYLEEEMDVQGARPLSLLNVTYVTNSMWNGKFGANGVNVGTEYAWHEEEELEVNFLGLDGLEAQNIEGLKAHRMRANRPTGRAHPFRAAPRASRARAARPPPGNRAGRGHRPARRIPHRWKYRAGPWSSRPQAARREGRARALSWPLLCHGFPAGAIAPDIKFEPPAGLPRS